MGYHLKIVKTGQEPYDDPVTTTGMRRLIEAAERSGMDLDVGRQRYTAGCLEKGCRCGEGPGPMEYLTLREALDTMDCYWITPDECEGFALKLPEAAPDSDDPKFIREMAQFFRKGAKAGGVYIC